VGAAPADLGMATLERHQRQVPVAGERALPFADAWLAVLCELEKAADLGLAGEVSDAVHGLAGFVARLAEEVDGETTDRLHAVSEDVPSLFLACMSEVETPATAQNEQRWFWRARVHRQAPTALDANVAQGLQTAVDLAVGNPIRDLLAARGRAYAAIADLALAVGDLERRST